MVQNLLASLSVFGREVSAEGVCEARVITWLNLTEILPNAVGVDDGNEFIELYSPNDKGVDLSEYKLFVEPELNGTYDFPIGSVIYPHAYASFSNSEIRFSLLNLSSRVLLALQDGFVISEVDAYQDPKDGMSRAYIEGSWQYASYPTPGYENIAKLMSASGSIISLGSGVAPCVANQYRNPETNRCRAIKKCQPQTMGCWVQKPKGVVLGACGLPLGGTFCSGL